MPSSDDLQNNVDDLSPINNAEDSTHQFHDFARPQNNGPASNQFFQNDDFANTNTGSDINEPNAGASTVSVTSDALFKQLTKAAKTYNVKVLKYDVNPTRRRDDFMDWIDKMKEVTYTQADTMDVLDNYPSLPRVIDVDVNKVLAQLFRAYVTNNVKAFLLSVQKEDGLGIILVL